MPTLLHPAQRQEWYRDIDGVLATSQHADGVSYHTFDYADHLDGGETISTSAWESSGVTTANAAATTTTTSIKVTGSDGYVKNTLVTTGGAVARTLIYLYRFVGTPLGKQERYVA
jgi:hypothetical protein